MVSNTGATLSAFLATDPSLSTGRISTAVFHLPDGPVAPAITVNILIHNVHKPTHIVNIVPSLVSNLLLRTSKLIEAGYTAIYNKDKVNYYDTCTTKFTVSADVVLKG